ncbi:MAG: outer membrane lipoprotein carrier protein LolA [Holophaga sp.]|nr:outer membrane lipoprotein carrier protein LolA [Holophaga sp.]
MKTLLTCLFLPAMALHAQVLLPGNLTAHLKEAAIIHLDFTQTRTLAALSRPLKASGSLVLTRDKGVIWALKRPVALTYVMGPKGLTVVNSDGSRERKTARDAPMVAQMGQIFQALAQGDWQVLGNFFTVTGDGGPTHWEVTMLPRPQAAAFVKRVRLDGGRFIDRIRVEEAAGDRMELVFQHQTLDVPLTGAETALLAQE